MWSDFYCIWLCDIGLCEYMSDFYNEKCRRKYDTKSMSMVLNKQFTIWFSNFNK